MKRSIALVVVSVVLLCCMMSASVVFGEERISIKELENVFMERCALSTTECDSLIEREASSDHALLQLTGGDEAETAIRIGMFIPNRIMDLLDIISFQIYLPLQLKTPGFHITRFCNLLELTAGWEQGFGWEYRRNLCLYGAMGLEANLFALTAYDLDCVGIGTNWLGNYTAGSGKREYAKKLSYSDHEEQIYVDEIRDPWGIGFYDDLEIHPVEIVDAVVGIVTFGFIDLSGDDYGP